MTAYMRENIATRRVKNLLLRTTQIVIFACCKLFEPSSGLHKNAWCTGILPAQ